MTLLVDTNGEPYYYQAYENDPGIDLPLVGEQIVLNPGERHLAPTGLFLGDVPSGYFGMICPRSGLAHKQGVTVLNAPGVVDPGYEGEIKVNLINHGSSPVVLEPGNRIAQLIFSPFLATNVSKEVRGAKGHGSSSL